MRRIFKQTIQRIVYSKYNTQTGSLYGWATIFTGFAFIGAAGSIVYNVSYMGTAYLVLTLMATYVAYKLSRTGYVLEHSQ